MASKTPQSGEWTTVSEARGKFTLDTVGDQWEGFYEGVEIIQNPNARADENPDMTYLNFRTADGDPYATSASYDLTRAFESIAVGTYVRITLTNLVPRNKGNDLKLHKVDVRK